MDCAGRCLNQRLKHSYPMSPHRAFGCLSLTYGIRPLTLVSFSARCLAYISGHQNDFSISRRCPHLLVVRVNAGMAISKASSGCSRKHQTNRCQKALSIIQKDTVFSIILIGVTLCSFGYSHLSSTLPQYLSASL